MFVVEGEKGFEEILNSNAPLKHCYTTDESILQKLQHHRPSFSEAHWIHPTNLEQISQLKQPNKVVCIVEQEDLNKMLEWNESVYYLALDRIKDPGNMGTIIRIADWFGIEALLLSKECVDPYNAKVVQATMGSVLRVKMHLVDLANQVLKAEFPIYASALDGIPLKETQFKPGGIILIGNESNGLNDKLLKNADHKIKISGKGHAESLNAAIATGIICHHILG